MPDNPTPELLKKMKLDTSGGPSALPTNNGSSTSKEPSRAATVRDEEDEEMDMDMAMVESPSDIRDFESCLPLPPVCRPVKPVMMEQMWSSLMEAW